MTLTTDQINSFNEYQNSGVFHPFTCGNNHPGNRELHATPGGLCCPSCDYVQDWTHAWMLDHSWKTKFPGIGRFGKQPIDWTAQDLNEEIERRNLGL